MGSPFHRYQAEVFDDDDGLIGEFIALGRQVVRRAVVWEIPVLPYFVGS
jgi:hypothetical protein